jgi:transcription elongation GreA/GreB family factor
MMGSHGGIVAPPDLGDHGDGRLTTNRELRGTMRGNSKLVIVETGSRVRIQAEQVEEWTIVAPHEADVLKRRLSELSPLGFALLGHCVGDQVRFWDGGARRAATILEVA